MHLPASPPLQAIMMGPFVMAGLTHDTRVLVADPANIPQYIGEVAPEDDTVSWEVRPSLLGLLGCLPGSGSQQQLGVASASAPPGCLPLGLAPSQWVCRRCCTHPQTPNAAP
jgi:hypothetical protein